MRILALQLKRIGDLILTAPAIRTIREKWPSSHITLAASGPATGLLGAIPEVDAAIAFGTDRRWTPWQQVLTGAFDQVLDFTGSDRSALATALSRAPSRVGFQSVKKAGLRRLAYTSFIDAAVREVHTADHYRHLVLGASAAPTEDPAPALKIPDSAARAADALLRENQIAAPFALIHPGTARPEKNWVPERWAEVIEHLRSVHCMDVLLTGGTALDERAHLDEILRPGGGVSTPAPASAVAHHSRGRLVSAAGAIDLCGLAALARSARLVISCDTAMVHLAAAFKTPQIALFGPTNPFHWRPRHARAMVLSAAQPEAPLLDFTSRMRGAPMADLSTQPVVRAIDALLAEPSSPPLPT